MKIDRQRFLSLVLGMASGPLVGCGGAARSEAVATPARPVTVSVAVDAECVDWSPSGQCLAYAAVSSPTPSVEPVAEVAPTGECYGWDANGTCVEWVPDTVQEPVDECVQFDPTGECVAWG